MAAKTPPKKGPSAKHGDAKPGKPHPPKGKSRPAKASEHDRTRVIALAAAGVAAVGSLVAATLLARRPKPNPAEHAAPDLAPDAPEPGTHRAPEAFRPDPTAIPTAEERESLRPATGPAPGFAADRGSSIG
ncbi:hypothetical protein [Sphingomonas abaci]|uniref:Uncharacterized protein n=1 Tax=Sphingomonas abaci TaxID=237611 RepID=A0A7W7EYL4_9SPHN|nr:hypothetical protein [Sphingomonas abaci]MBB4618797.1 hypothetical protein [Sphingomonas abaci]